MKPLAVSWPNPPKWPTTSHAIPQKIEIGREMEIVRPELGPNVNANKAVLPKGATPARRVTIS